MSSLQKRDIEIYTLIQKQVAAVLQQLRQILSHLNYYSENLINLIKIFYIFNCILVTFQEINIDMYKQFVLMQCTFYYCVRNILNHSLYRVEQKLSNPQTVKIKVSILHYRKQTVLHCYKNICNCKHIIISFYRYCVINTLILVSLWILYA